MKPIKIIQMSRPRTCSTVLVNIVMGLYDHQSPVTASDKPRNAKIIKTHRTRYGYWSKNYQKSHDLYFICSERAAEGKRISKDTREKPNVFVFDYEELIAESVVEDVHKALAGRIPEYADLEKAKERLVAMNKVYEEIKHLPFSYWDKFYHIHGSHKSRRK